VPGYHNGLASTLNNLGALQKDLGQRQEAHKSYAEAAALRRALVKAQPEVPEYQLDLSRPLLGQAMLLRQQRRPEEGRRHLDEALPVLGGLQRTHPNYPGVDFFRFLAHQERARALAAVGQRRTALRDWDRAVALAPANRRLGVRLARADALARAGEHDRAA